MLHPAPDRLVVREVHQEDAEAVARLSGELGYSATPDLMKQRIASLQSLTDRIVYVACVAEEVVGWIEVDATSNLASGPRAEISGLVVSSSLRSRGIGRLLVARAEQWAAERRLGTMLVRSRESREAAHRFYLREGYLRTKTSAVFAKALVLLLTLTAGISLGQSHTVEIKFPASVDSERVFLRYVLSGAPLGNWVQPRPGVSSYLISTMVEGRRAAGIRALIYAPGCAIQTLDVPLDSLHNDEYEFLCVPVGNISITGKVIRADRLYGRHVRLRARIIVRWAPDDVVAPIPVGDAVYVAEDGRFCLTIPDFARDPLAGAPAHPGELQIWAEDPASGDMVAQLVPSESSELKTRLGLKLLSEYPSEIVFTPCAAQLTQTHDREGFAVRPDRDDACDW